MKQILLVLIPCVLAIVLALNVFSLRGSNEELQLKYKKSRESALSNLRLVKYSGRNLLDPKLGENKIKRVKEIIGKSEKTLTLLFNLTVCGSCLHEQLAIVNSFKDSLERKHVKLFAIIGVSDNAERTDVLTLEKSGLLSFPYILATPKELNTIFSFDSEVAYRETPFYFFTDSQLTILSCLNPEGSDPSSLVWWLKSISQQEQFN